MAEPGKKPQEYHRLVESNSPPLHGYIGKAPPALPAPPVPKPRAQVAPPPPRFPPKPKYVTRGKGPTGKARDANLKASREILRRVVDKPWQRSSS